MSSHLPLQDIIKQLRKDISCLQGDSHKPTNNSPKTGLGVIEKSFPNAIFPTGAVHELISPQAEHAAATNGFIAGMLSSLMQHKRICLWISTHRDIFPATLPFFGIAPERIVFVDLHRQKEVLWVVEECLKCDSVMAVVGELRDLTFTESQRLQLAVEASGVTGFIHRFQPLAENPVACVTRWKISPMPSHLENGMPGVGFPRWHVQLAKVRNGIPGAWNIEWYNGGFRHISPQIAISQRVKRKAG